MIVADPPSSAGYLIEPVLEEIRAQLARQTLAANAKDYGAVILNAKNHAERLTDAVTTIANFEAIGDSAAGNLPIDDLLTALLTGTRTMLACHVASLLIMEPDGGLLWPRSSSGFRTIAGVRPLTVNGRFREIVDTGEPWLVAEVEPADAVGPDLKGEGIRSLVAVPMKTGGVVKGVVLCGQREPRRFTARDLELVQLVAARMLRVLERRGLLQSAERKQLVAEETSKFKTQLLQMATHDVKTPLTAINLHLAVLARPGVREEERQRSIVVMQRSVRRASQMLDEFLDLARVQAGHLDIRPAAMDASRLLQDTVELFTEQAKKGGVTLEILPSASVMAYGDERRILQVLSNLVSNAIRYSPSPGTIHVGAQASERHVEFHVQDQGKGMTPEQLARLFHPFTQVHGSAEEAQGTGLGLYLAKAIVNAHGSELYLTSDGPGQGTKAVFTLRKPP